MLPGFKRDALNRMPAPKQTCRRPPPMSPTPKPHPTPIHDAARPLLRLAGQVSGMETAFASICWMERGRRLLLSADEQACGVATGITAHWHETFCRPSSLRDAQPGLSSTIVPESAAAAGIQSFCAVPILVGDSAIGTLCTASRRAMELAPEQIDGLKLVAESLQKLLAVERDRGLALMQADRVVQDLEDARRATAHHAAASLRMERLAHTDSLTGLANRRAFMARWSDSLAREKLPLGLILIDADGFKLVNDTFGHLKGDAVLLAISAALMTVARSPDIVARLGGDEFAFATADGDPAKLLAKAEGIQVAFAEVAAELGVATTLSIGIVSSEDCTPDRMIVEADKAVYRSKLAHGNQPTLYRRNRKPPKNRRMVR
jgi:diguanylate cyclase (GGDEF)-like protein